MNDETLECEVGVFIKHYLPRHDFLEGRYNAIFGAGVARAEEHFRKNLPFTKEGEMASSLQIVVDAIVKASGGEDRCRQYRVLSNHTTIPCFFQVDNLEIDACLSLDDEKFKACHATNVVVAMELKLDRNYDTVYQVSTLWTLAVHLFSDSLPSLANGSYRR